jgi:mannitol PTS system EIICBA or EIICB component
MNKLGRLLSAIVYQNVAALIFAGVIQALFGVYGWWPNDRISLLVDPMINNLIPVLFGYTGGRLLGGQRGAVVAATVTLGFTLASSVPVIIGSMLIGPFVGWLIAWIDKKMENRLPTGSELLLQNVIAAIIAIVLTVFCFTYVGQAFSDMIKVLNRILEIVVNSGWLPLLSLIIEPAKVFFFNNVINYGILGPIGIQQTKDMGKSIFFLLESNPGPGIGMLFAYLLHAKREQRRHIRNVLFIHGFGGIHEVYFPFVLMQPRLFLSIIAGGIAGIGVFQYFDVGLVSIPSPGSVLVLAALSPHDDLPFVLIGVFISAILSFATACLLLRIDRKKLHDPAIHTQTLDEIQVLQNLYRFEGIAPVQSSPQSTQTQAPQRPIRHVVFACDAGLGSSSMGAAFLKKKLKAFNLDIHVSHASVDEIPVGADLVITHKNLTARARERAPKCEHMSVDSFTDMNLYDSLVERLTTQKSNSPESRKEDLSED